MQCTFYVLGADDPLFLLDLPSLPPRGQIVRFANRFWTVEETELRVAPGTQRPDPQGIVWLQERLTH
jgi:hypothetical protein